MMTNKTIRIKNMVCSRCVKVVREELEKLGLQVNHVTLGEANVNGDIDKQRINEVLLNNGFELLDDRQAKIIEKIKIAIIEIVYQKEKVELLKISSSKYLSNKLGISYHYLSSLFSSSEGITIEKHIINMKVEKVKELLVYDELTLSEISYRLGYSSVQHLSNQFKKTTGFSPSQFKHLKEIKRIPLDKIL